MWTSRRATTVIVGAHLLDAGFTVGGPEAALETDEVAESTFLFDKQITGTALTTFVNHHGGAPPF
jgi:hypothetical protein